MRDRYSGKSRGFGFVTFQTAADAQRVAALDHIVDGRRCDAKLALPRGAPAASPAAAVPVAAPVATTHRHVHTLISATLSSGCARLLEAVLQCPAVLPCCSRRQGTQGSG